MKNRFPSDWLLPLEILEIVEKENLFPGMARDIKEELVELSVKREAFSKLIKDGLNLIYNT